MTSEPTREPADDESAVDATPPTEASAEQLAEAEAMAAAEAAAISAADADAISGAETMSAAEASAPARESGAEMTAAAEVAPAPGAPLSEAVVADAPVATPAIDPAVPAKPRRRTVFLAATRRVLSFAFGVALFVGGVAIGINAFQANRPFSTVTEGLVPRTGPPPVAQEFITALAANDHDALRSSLDTQPHRDITGEMTRFGIQKVHRVETLGTEVDGTRSATEIMMMAENVDGLPFAVNLVILVDGGKIEGFR